MNDDQETLFEFPCDFPIKAIGRLIGGHGDDDLATIVCAIIRRHAPDVSETAVKTRSSQRANYLSITVTITARSRAQLDAIYQDLTRCEHIVMVL